MNTDQQKAWDDLLRTLDPEDLKAAGPGYVVTAPDTDSVSFADSDDWSGKDAVSSYPDPGGDDTDMTAFRSNFVFSPSEGSDEAETKSAYKAPIRDSHAGAVNPGALKAVISAINGGRGGFKGVGQDKLKDGFNAAVRLAVAAGVYDDKSDAPDFSGSSASDPDPSDPISATDAFEGSSGVVEAASDQTRQSVEDGLTGVIWAAGEHTLSMNGEPTTIHVPPETIEPTYRRLRSRIEAGDLPDIGFDHPESDSVAANTPLGQIGKVDDVALSEDGRQIVMTDSHYTNNMAVKAAQQGAFDGYEYSVVGAIGAATTEAGEKKRTDSGAIEVSAVRIDRPDVVPNGAIQGPPVGVMPNVQVAASIAAGSPDQPATGFVQAIRAASGSTETKDKNMGNDQDFNGTYDTVEAANSALRDASDVIEARDERIDELQDEKDDLKVQASAFEDIAAAHGVDIEDDDTDVQDVIDAHTADMREEVAQLEASLPKYDTDEDGIEARAEDLAGSGINELQVRAGKLSQEVLRSDQAREGFGKAISASESGGAGSSGGGGGGSGGSGASDELQAMTDSALGPIQASEARKDYDGDFVEYVQAEHGIDPSDHPSDMSLMSAINSGEN